MSMRIDWNEPLHNYKNLPSVVDYCLEGLAKRFDKAWVLILRCYHDII